MAGRYHLLDHPVQQRVAQTLAEWSGVAREAIVTAVDGCGLPTFALPLDAVALACARFAAAAADGATPAAAIVAAMRQHPEYVAGTGRLCTAVMQAASAGVFAKVGAEGYYCAGVPSLRLGIALKVEDGARRASEPALLATLHALGALTETELEHLREFAHPPVLNTRGEVVGEIRAHLPLR
jgi:L-asparaginase II